MFFKFLSLLFLSSVYSQTINDDSDAEKGVKLEVSGGHIKLYRGKGNGEDSDNDRYLSATPSLVGEYTRGSNRMVYDNREVNFASNQLSWVEQQRNIKYKTGIKTQRTIVGTATFNFGNNAQTTFRITVFMINDDGSVELDSKDKSYSMPVRDNEGKFDVEILNWPEKPDNNTMTDIIFEFKLTCSEQDSRDIGQSDDTNGANGDVLKSRKNVRFGKFMKFVSPKVAKVNGKRAEMDVVMTKTTDPNTKITTATVRFITVGFSGTMKYDPKIGIESSAFKIIPFVSVIISLLVFFHF